MLNAGLLLLKDTDGCRVQACIVSAPVLANVRLSTLAWSTAAGVRLGLERNGMWSRPHSDCGTCGLGEAGPSSAQPPPLLLGRGNDHRQDDSGHVQNWVLAGHGGTLVDRMKERS